MNIKCPFLHLLINLSLKSILLDIRIDIPACFLDPFDWKNLFPTLYSEVISLWKADVCFCTKQKDESCFHIYSVRLCLYIGKLSPLLLRDINYQWLLISVIFVLFLLVVVFVCYLYCGICWYEIIHSLCFGGCN